MASISLKYKSKQGSLTAPGDVDPGAMIPIATVNVGAGGASSVDFLSIPNTYEHLQIRAIFRGTAAGSSTNDLVMRFNSDNSANYSQHYVYGSGSIAAAGGQANYTYIPAVSIMTDGWTANVFGVSIIDILDYANTNKFKTTRTLNGFDTNGGGEILFNSGNWRSTNAINAIVFAPYSGSFKQYSTFSLYGIKRAGA